MYSMGRAGTLPKPFAKIHPRFRTPSNAVHAVGIISFVLIIGVGNWVGASQIFGFLGEIITIGIILMYIAGNTALTRYMYTQHHDSFNVWLHAILPTIGSLLLLPVLYVTFHPFPPWPFNIAPYFVIAWMLLGVVIMVVLERRDPAALTRGGELFAAPVLSPVAEELAQTLPPPSERPDAAGTAEDPA
jgi:amino acid transporter